MKVSILGAVVCAALLACSGCGKPPAADLLKRAQATEDAKRKTLDTMKVRPDMRAFLADALDDYGRLIDEYESTPESEIALFRRAMILGGDVKDHAGAVRDYSLYAERYPQGAKTPMVMFLVGYLYNNELHQLDSAGAAYRRFLAAYPDHELAGSARYELENLGKSPDELIFKEPPAEAPAPKQKARVGS